MNVVEIDLDALVRVKIERFAKAKKITFNEAVIFLLEKACTPS